MERPLCTKCKKNPATKNFNTLKSGEKVFQWSKLCSPCTKRKYVGTTTHISKYRKLCKARLNHLHCELCPFVAIHVCQLDVHHLDENHKNNAIENLIVICANCHRLKHKRK